MARHTHQRYVLLFVLKLLIIILLLQGCKEGTDSSTISDLLVNPNTAETIILDELDTSKAIHKVVGEVLSESKQLPLSNIKVSMFYGNRLIAQTRTTSEGKFYFSKIAPGLFDITALDQNGAYASQTIPIQVLENGEVSPAEIKIALAEKRNIVYNRPIKGYVKCRKEGSTTAKAVAGAKVALKKDSSSSASIDSTITETDGAFILQQGLSAGIYYLCTEATPTTLKPEPYLFRVWPNGDTTPFIGGLDGLTIYVAPKTEGEADE